ncbi:ABC transporter substrate-binding protein [Nocardiopsis mangrovi]|uniref:ABC transporter substrate-binding protein n=1 Tax=Nocardiopsis mangrovi TaxID=1179818 RepID=A0ABV9DUV8_9ACTN
MSEQRAGGRRRGAWRLRLTAGAVALSALAAGCTEYGGNLSGTTASEGSGDTVVVSETAGVPMAFLSYGVRRGHFDDQGITLELRASSGGATVIPALLSEDIDVAGSNVVSAMIAMGRRMPVTMVTAGTSAADRAEDDFSSIMVAEDSPVEEPEDLEATRVAVNTLQNINDVAIHSAMTDRGVDARGIDFVEMPLPDMPAAIQRGDVDAGLLIEPFASIGRSQGLRDVVRPYTDLRSGLQIGTYLMTTRTVGDRPELVDAFQAGVAATAEDVARDPEAFRDALPEISDLDPELAARMNLPRWSGATDRESIEAVHAVMVDIGLTDAELDFGEAAVG